MSSSLLLACLLAQTDLAPAPETASVGRPNVVVVLTDDQGWGDLSRHGNPVLATPRLDALADQSVVLQRFYVTPVCSPTRVSLLTGRYHHRTRVTQTYFGLSMMDPDEVTLAERLAAAGYATGLFGKWHLGNLPPMRPGDQGFERSLVHLGAQLGLPGDEDAYTDARLLSDGVWTETEGYCTEVFFDAALRWIEETHRAQRPFFCLLAPNVPHTPLSDPPDAEYARYREAEFGDEPTLDADERDRAARVYAMLADLDAHVGRLLDRLDELALARDTIVVFLSDNGPRGRRYSAGLRGGKGTVYENGIRTPFFLRWPARVTPGQVTGVAHAIDLAPTLLEACGVDVPDDGPPLDGRSLLPLLLDRGAPWPERTLVVQHHRGQEPLRYRNVAVRTHAWKLVNAVATDEELTLPPSFALYAIEDDPFEEHDLANRHPEVVARLTRAYEDWWRDVSTSRPDNFLPPPIPLPTGPAATPLALSNEERLRDPGRWRVEVVTPGPYRVELPIPEQVGARHLTARLTIGARSWTASARREDAVVRFDDVRPEPGVALLSAALIVRDRELEVRDVRVSLAP